MLAVSLSTSCCHNGNVLLMKSITMFLLGTTFFNSFCIILKWCFFNASSSPMRTKAGTNGIDGILDFGVDGDDNDCVSLLGVPLFCPLA